jgi:hypothetical protein
METRRSLSMLARAGVLLLTLVALAGVLFLDTNAGAKLAGVVSVLGLAVALGPMMRRPGSATGREPTDSELRNAASSVARAAQQRWLSEAAMRRITVPATVRVSWKRIDRSSESARPPKGARPREIPTEAPPEVLDAGKLNELYSLYCHPDVDKIVVLGEPGAGKSGLLIQLLLEALRVRDRAPEAKRFEIPVPMLLTLGDWSPEQQSLVDWADGVLRRDYGPAVGSGGVSIYRQLLEDGRIALFLDGLDEMPRGAWRAAAQRIQEAAQLRVVVSARPEAARDAQVAFAARIVLEPVGVRDAAAYLRSACDPRIHPQLWEAAAERLTRDPHGAPATCLSTPLMLTLALNTFDREHADPIGLFDEERFPDATSLETFLVSQIVPVAYAAGAGQGSGGPGPSAEAAERSLRALATKMGGTRDLAWWRIRRWAPAVAPALVCLAFMCAVGFDAAVLGGIDLGIAMGLPGALAATVAGAAAARIAMRRGRGQARGVGPRLFVAALVGSVFGVCLVLVPRLEDGQYPAGLGTALLGFALGGVGGVGVGILAAHDGPLVASPRRVSRPDALFGSAAGLMTGLIYGLAEGAWIGVGLGIIAALGFMIGIAWTRPSDSPESGATPLSSFRRDLRGAALLTAVVSITATGAFAVVLSETHGVLDAVLAAAGLSFPFAFLVGVATSQASALMLTSWWLHLRARSFPRTLLAMGGSSDAGREARVARAAGFLEDAHERDVLRSVGTLYQFRHGRLQDQLREDRLAPRIRATDNEPV